MRHYTASRIWNTDSFSGNKLTLSCWNMDQHRSNTYWVHSIAIKKEQYTLSFRVWECVRETAEGLHWLHLKRSFSGRNLPSSSHALPPDLHPGLTGSFKQGCASVLGQSTLIVPLCFSITVLPEKGPKQALNWIPVYGRVCFRCYCQEDITMCAHLLILSPTCY